MDQDNVSYGDVPGSITPPTPKYVFESEPEEGEIVGDPSEWEPLPRLKKWVIAAKKSSLSSSAMLDRSAEFPAKYATWIREYEELWKQVQEMKENGKDVAASKIVAIRVAVKSRGLHELREAFGLTDAADLARELHQQKAERSRASGLRYDEEWARPGTVDLILQYLPYKAERTTVVAALREFRGRISYAIDYLMPGKGIADMSDSDSGYAEDPPTPGKGVDCNFSEDDPPTPVKGIDFDMPENDPPPPGNVSDVQSFEQMWADVRELRTSLHRVDEKLDALLSGALARHR